MKGQILAISIFFGTFFYLLQLNTNSEDIKGKDKFRSVQVGLITDFINNIDNSKKDRRVEARDALMQFRHDQFIYLIRIAATTHRQQGLDSKTALAIQSLGIMRAEEAVPWLTSHINYRNEVIIETETTYYPEYPCANALIAIGYPSVKEILKRNLYLVEHEHLKLYAGVVREVLGYDFGKTLLDLTLKTKTGQEKEGLIRFIKIYDAQKLS